MILNNLVEVTTFYNLDILKKIFWNAVSQSIYYILLTLYSEDTLPIMGTKKKVRRNNRKRDNINRKISNTNNKTKQIQAGTTKRTKQRVGVYYCWYNALPTCTSNLFS